MSDTPRTDARLGHENQHHGANMLCRELERELNQAIKERDEARRAFDDIDMCKLGQAPCAWAIQLIKQRDENKAGWDNASLVALRLERERNEARECLREKLFDCVANQKSLTGYEPAGPATVYLESRSITETGKV